MLDILLLSFFINSCAISSQLFSFLINQSILVLSSIDLYICFATLLTIVASWTSSTNASASSAPTLLIRRMLFAFSGRAPFDVR